MSPKLTQVNRLFVIGHGVHNRSLATEWQAGLDGLVLFCREPGSLVLLGAGVVGLVGYGYRRRK